MKRMNRDEVMELAEYVCSELGSDLAYLELCKGLSADDLQEVLEFVCRMHDLNQDGGEPG